MSTKKEAANAASGSQAKKRPGRKPVTAAEPETVTVAEPETVTAAEKETVTAASGSQVKKKPGRKPMTAAEKEAAAKTRAQQKAKAENLKPEFIVQYQGADIDLAALAETAKADFRQAKKRTLITEMKLYVKPEEHTVYYVINEGFTGSIAY